MAPLFVWRGDFFLKEHNIFSVISGEEHTHSLSPFFCASDASLFT
jgi:hypothetical protein